MVKYSNKLLVELLILFILATFATTFFYIARVCVVDGDSMFPSLKSGERILVDKRAYVYVSPVTGDVIGMIDPNEPNNSYVKRIIARQGDTIEVTGSDVLVNGLPVYKVSNNTASSKKKIIPLGYYFVMGDNRNISYDSRNFGFVPKSNIIGKAAAVVWPPSSIRIIK